MSIATSRRRTELADFLRTRRERLTPDDVGLPTGGRRRTPGLRREEVALLAGVGVTWYTWLEQGRDINASVQVLEAIARTLRMDSQERWHLFQLAGVTIVPPPSQCPGLPAGGQDVLDQLDPFPAAIVSSRYDVLGYNRAYNRMMGDLDAVEPGERNTLWLFFTSPYMQGLCLGNRDTAAAHLVGTMRAAMAQHVDDPLWTGLVQRLCEASEEFDAIWRRHDVVDRALPLKDFTSPVGDLHLQVTRFEVGENGGARMMVYSPRDSTTRDRLGQLVEHDAAQRLRAV
ncbi:helix-turn-helix transcriptional regulator [Nocardioides panacisoli]|uniref:Helix-turn-helix transcriptional regulator n=1 Tax=Nocardioides panacisoli TaxID=627624 RepID=A0ABP7IR22_9ACTN